MKAYMNDTTVVLFMQDIFHHFFLISPCG